MNQNMNLKKFFERFKDIIVMEKVPLKINIFFPDKNFADFYERIFLKIAQLL